MEELARQALTRKKLRKKIGQARNAEACFFLLDEDKYILVRNTLDNQKFTPKQPVFRKTDFAKENNVCWGSSNQR